MMKRDKSQLPFLVHNINMEVINAWSDGQSHLADVKYRTLISKFDVEQRKPNAMVLKRRIAMVLKS